MRVRRGGFALLATALLLVAPAALAAQRVTSSLSAGAVSVRYADEPALSALTLSPTLTYSTSRALAGLGGTFSLADEGRWSSQGTLLGSLLTPMSRSGWLGELGGMAGGSVHADGARTAQMMALARVHRAGTTFAAWAGFGAGSMWDGVAWNGVQQAELGATRRGTATFPPTLTATLQPTRTADTLRFTDAQVAMTMPLLDRFELRASLGGRMGAAWAVLGRNDRVWGDVGVTAWLDDRIALVAAAGAYPVDPTQGFPSGQFISIALRLGGRRPLVLPTTRGEERARHAAVSAGVRAFEAQRLAGDRVRLRVRAPDARAVDLMGDPTTWVPVALTPAENGWWTIVIAAAPGAHELVVRVDGGEWVVPPDLPVVVDEFGGRTGRLVIDAPPHP